MLFSTRRRIASEPDSEEKFQKPTTSEVRRLFRYLIPYRSQMGIAVITLIFGSLLGLVFPWIIQILVDTVLQNGDLNELNRVTILLIFIFLVRSVFYYFQVYYLSFVGERIIVDLRNQTFEHIQTLSLEFFSNRKVGELVSRLSSDVTLIRSALTNNVATVLSQSITFIGSLVLMLILNWRLTVYILSVSPIIIGSAAVFGTRLRKLSTKVQDELAESTAIVEETLSGIRIVKAFTREDYEAKKYKNQTEVTFRVVMRQAVLRSAFGPLITFFAFSALAGVLWVGGREVLAGRLTAGALIAFLVYGINIASSLGSFSSLYTQIQEASGAARRIFEILDTKNDIREIPDAIRVEKPEGWIKFDNVSFSYSHDNRVLQSISFDIQPGEVLALVGPSGAGKTTIFNLIPRFYDPKSGSIFLDGIDLKKLSVADLRTHIGLVPQETLLFSTSIKENILYGRLNASESEIISAAKAANADEFIDRLPQGYNTTVGEKGIKLSGGQRQRVAIARAILRNPRILLLDEATSSLDSESESLVQDALERLMKDRTTVMIAHRLSTVQMADRIAVLDKGNLIELGTHDQLMTIDGIYARLFRMQFREDLLTSFAT